jgi:hypothetical protein
MKRVSRLHGSGVLVILIAAGCLAGCRGSSLNPKSDLELRLDAANSETVQADREKSLSIIAPEAAEEADYRLALQALNGINDPKLRDRTAAECAVRLVKAGDRTDANKMAATIKDSAVRNDTLKRLADNDVGATEAITEPTSRPTEPTTRPTTGLGH